MMLARDGKFRLDDRVTRFFPNFGVHGKTVITFRHLLAHCSGLAAWRPFYQRIAEIEKGGRVNFMASYGAKEFTYEEIHREKPEAPPATKDDLLGSRTSSLLGETDRKSRERRAQPVLPREDFPPARAARDRLYRHLAGALAPARAGRRHVRADRNLSVAQAAAGRRGRRRERVRDGRSRGSCRTVRAGARSRSDRARADRVLRGPLGFCSAENRPRVLDARRHRTRLDLGARMGHAVGRGIPARAIVSRRRRSGILASPALRSGSSRSAKLRSRS